MEVNETKWRRHRRSDSGAAYYAAAGSGISGAEGGFDVSATPWPRQSGQELRPVVNHWQS